MTQDPALEALANMPDMAFVLVAANLLAATPEYAERFAAALLTRAQDRVDVFAAGVEAVVAGLLCSGASAIVIKGIEPASPAQLDGLVAAAPDLTTIQGLAEALRVLATFAPLPASLEPARPS